MSMQPLHVPIPQQPLRKRGLGAGAIGAIVAAMIAVPVAGIVVVGIHRYQAAARTAEAKNTVVVVARAAAAAYGRESLEGTTAVHQLCKSSQRVPAVPPVGKKYAPSAADYNTGDGATGWKCLRFSLSQPTYYAYKYDKGAGSGKSGATPNGFEASATGDVDGNGVHSFFARGADVRDGKVIVSNEIYVENEFE
jgi:type IV pilus assembly protein PilA